MIPHSRPFLGIEEEKVLAAVVRSGQLAAGERVLAFERALRERVGLKHAVALSSGTAALHVGLLALGVGPGDEVAIPTYVCSALLNAVRHAGARPLLIDVSPETFDLAPEDLLNRMTRRTRAVIFPHMFGLPGKLEAFRAAGIPIIEDCAMSLGASKGGRPVGGWGDLSAFSFYATKMIACGEGGMLGTQREDLAAGALDVRQYDGRDDARIRFNYKMTDLQGALGVVQMRRLDAFVGRRRGLAARYRSALSGKGCRLPDESPDHIYYRFVIRQDRDVGELISAFERQGVAARRPVACPLHRVLGVGGRDFPGAEEAYRQAISLPLYPALSEEEVETVIRAAREIL